MSKDIEQVYTANPITSNTGTDLMYFGQSPYGAGNDAAMTYANFSAQFGSPYTPSALTSANDTNVIITLGGSPTTALLHAASITMGWTGQLSLTRGGSNASLTASAGGIVWSDSTKLNILAGTSTSNQLLLSGNALTPSWSTSTYPSTNSINTLLYASSANTMAALATANSGVLITSSGGVPSIGTTLPIGVQTNITELGTIIVGTWNGSLVTGTYGGTGVNNGASTITIGGSVTFTGAFTFAGTLTNTTAVTFPTSGTLATTTQTIAVVDQNSSSVTLAPNTRYVIDNGASLVTLTLPTSATIGDTYWIVGKSSGGWKVGQPASAIIHYGTSTSTTGTGGSIASSNQYDCVTLTCNTTNTTFTAYGSQGALTVV